MNEVKIEEERSWRREINWKLIEWRQPGMTKSNEMTPQGHRGKPIQQLFFLWARSAPSKKKIIAEMEGMAGGNLMEEGRP